MRSPLPEAGALPAVAGAAAPPLGRRIHLVFGGPTALARAFLALEAAGCGGAIVSAPRAGGPCGLAIAVAPEHLPAAREILGALGLPVVEARP